MLSIVALFVLFFVPDDETYVGEFSFQRSIMPISEKMMPKLGDIVVRRPARSYQFRQTSRFYSFMHNKGFAAIPTGNRMTLGQADPSKAQSHTGNGFEYDHETGLPLIHGKMRPGAKIRHARLKNQHLEGVSMPAVPTAHMDFHGEDAYESSDGSSTRRNKRGRSRKNAAEHDGFNSPFEKWARRITIGGAIYLFYDMYKHKVKEWWNDPARAGARNDKRVAEAIRQKRQEQIKRGEIQAVDRAGNLSTSETESRESSLWSRVLSVVPTRGKSVEGDGSRS